jgi:hypothetical protein
VESTLSQDEYGNGMLAFTPEDQRSVLKKWIRRRMPLYEVPIASHHAAKMCNVRVGDNNHCAEKELGKEYYF